MDGCKLSKIKKWVYPQGDVYLGDCLRVMKNMKPQSVDLVFGSPPYEDARSYGELDFALVGQAWVDWMVRIVKASLRICKGLVAFVVGHGKNGVHNWSAAPALLMADLHRAGITLRNPALYKRFGIFGSGGKDWLRADYEWIICATNKPEELPWHNTVACGTKPKYGIGGVPSYRTKDGKRVNAMRGGCGYKDGDLEQKTNYRKEIELANPGNVIDCGAVGGGHLGSNIAHEGEAPFSEKLARFFIRSFCPPGGVVFDPFGGSGTSAAVAIKTGRKFITCDLRESQIKLIKRRIRQADLNKGMILDI